MRRRTKTSHRPAGRRATAVQPQIECLEDRAVPTIVFTPLYGAETATDGGGIKLSNVTVQPLFWGDQWNTTWSAEASRDVSFLSSLVGSSYFTRLQQYIGAAPHMSLASAVYDSSKVPTGTVSDNNLASAITAELSADLITGAVPPPSAFGGSIPIYLFFTPPGLLDSNSPGQISDGWNTLATVLTPTRSLPQIAHVPLIFCSSLDAGASSTALGHELAEVMTDPTEDTSGVTVTPGPNESASDPLFDNAADNQIGDHEARDWAYRLGGGSGPLVQPYWSQLDQGYVVPDGNSLLFPVNGGTHTAQFNEGSGSTLTILGGQNGLGTTDTVTINRTADGAISAVLDGQAVSFDAGAIANVKVLGGLGSLTVNLTGTWGDAGPGNATPAVWINAFPGAPATINLLPDPGGLDALTGNFLTVADPGSVSSINIDNWSDAYDRSWTLDGATVAVDGQSLVTYSLGTPSHVSLRTNSTQIDVEATTCPTSVSVRGSYSHVSLASASQNLCAIRFPLSLIGTINTLSIGDSFDNNPEPAVVLEKGSFSQGNMATVSFGAVTTVNYYAGPGADNILVAPSSRNLDLLPSNINLFPGGGKDSLFIDDTSHVASFINQYTIAPDVITRFSQRIGPPTSGGSTIAYWGLNGTVTLDTDNVGTPVNVEGVLASTPTTINVGTASTAVTVGGRSQTLTALGSVLTLNGGPGANTLTIDDQSDPSSGPGPYLVLSGSISRALTASPFAAQIVFTGFGAGVTLNTDNNGTPLDVEGTSLPTTVNLGSGNTTVSVTPAGQNLNLLGSPLTVNGGAGVDSLIINDALDPYASASGPRGSSTYSYTVSGQSVYRLWSYTGLLRMWSTHMINYSQLNAVTLTTDNNGTPVDIEGVTAPTTVNTGSGNTAVSVMSVGQNLSLLGSDVTVNGGAGADNLVVNDSQNPNASASGPRWSSTYAYNVAGAFVSRSWSYDGLYRAWLTRTINYSNLSGGLTLDTDNHGTPVDIEGTAVPTTVNVGSGSTAVSVTSGSQNLGLLASDLTVNGGAGSDSLVINDSQNPNAPASGPGWRSTYSYTVSGQSVSRTWAYYHLLSRGSTRTIHYSNLSAGVTLDTDNHGTPVNVSGSPGSNPVTLNGGSGTNTLSGPAVPSAWMLTGANTGSLDGWVAFHGMANLVGGSAGNNFDFNAGGSVTGSINGGSGPAWLNYARDPINVVANLATGTATGVGTTVANIQGVVGSTFSATLTGGTRSLLIGGGGSAQLTGGSGDTLLIGGGTIFDFNDVALEAILAEWDRTDLAFNARASDLFSGGGLNGAYELNGATITADLHPNTLTTGAGQTWFLAHTPDVVNKKPGDRVDLLP